ncbi:hypothetical protein PtrSN002B_001605 [Pyrenophora tritici-repentis]|nr:hypothetical protein Alg215_01314 [Pyrenophora tritici-repentis]KAI0589176.1 hypothetical protein Alg130_03068 [Pyrenophora tritici-repentis]KAI0609165.1 hypothetical protein TUN205_06607 [Pyrenophora tritici-repentis]KAI0624932.1 hypothetical protein TUN199_03067 [Pyrenophora tritici-repentis]KAI1546357.1 hypothetical protein PtrSN001A_001964 [Pyrenophora tritici-repentis]
MYHDLSRSKARIQLRETIRGETFDGVQITMPPAEIRESMETLRLVTGSFNLASRYPASASLKIISENWDVDMNNFPPVPRGYGGKTFRPAGDASTWDLRLLAFLAILADFTPGQGEYIGTLVNSAVELRSIDKRSKIDLHTVTSTDVVRVIRDMLHSLEEEEKKEDILAARKTKVEYDDKKKAEGKIYKETEQAIYTGLAVGGKEMEQVEKQLKKTALSEQLESDSDEEILTHTERME